MYSFLVITNILTDNIFCMHVKKNAREEKVQNTT